MIERWCSVKSSTNLWVVGAFLGRVNTPAKSLSAHVAISNAPTTNPVCRGGQYAGTLERLGAVTFGNRALGLDSLAVTKSSLVLGNRLDDKLTLAHLWIHELGHLLNSCKSQGPTGDSERETDTSKQLQMKRLSMDLAR